MKHEDLEHAYQSAVIGSKPPQLMVTSGEMILERRPDLKDEIDPEKRYYVTKDEIREVE